MWQMAEPRALSTHQTLRLGAVLAAFWLGACAHTPPVREADVPKTPAGFLVGYLPASELPDSRALLDPPPAAGSPQQLADLAEARAMLDLRDTARWAAARCDADLSYPNSISAFSCALGFTPDEARTPHLAMLLRRVVNDASQSTRAAKDAWRRERPFLSIGQGTCTPEDEAEMRESPSYPSGHAATGYLWALILAELAPDRAEVLLRRGVDYGHSRVVCGVHWPSDVEASRRVAPAVLARLRQQPDFVAQLNAARSEVQAWRDAALAPSCP